ncbi:unnamed protein product, partial [Staurois parvus]
MTLGRKGLTSGMIKELTLRFTVCCALLWLTVCVLYCKDTALHGCAQPSKAVCRSCQGRELFCL